MRKMISLNRNKFAALLMALLLALSLAFTSAQPVKCMDKFCENCEDQCEEDYLQLLTDCMNEGNPLLVCQLRNISWMDNCGTVFCPNCPWVQ